MTDFKALGKGETIKKQDSLLQWLFVSLYALKYNTNIISKSQASQIYSFLNSSLRISFTRVLNTNNGKGYLQNVFVEERGSKINR